jgi:hypothetical protein
LKKIKRQREMKMKQLLIVLSLIIAAFVAACASDANQKTHVKTSGGAQKTIKDLDVASSDAELKNLKKQLESIKNVELPDVIAAVKRKFGTTKINTPVARDQSKNLNSDNGTKIEEKPEEKVTNPSTFSGLALLDNPDVAEKAGNVETKAVCINTCDVQIIVKRKTDNGGKLIAVAAYVVAELKAGNFDVQKSTITKKTLDSIVASYEASSDTMNLKVFMTKETQKIVLNAKNYIYSSPLTSLEFSARTVGDNPKPIDSGTLTVGNVDEVKTLTLNFKIEGAEVIAFILNDYGLFGKKTAPTDANASADATKY